MGSEHYCLRWNNHQTNLLGVFSQLLRDESLVDVTLACAEGHSIRAHKVVLSACSSYFQSLFVDHPGRHPIVILKDVCFSELRTLVEFMYRGEVSVEYCRLSALLKTAESLKVKGLAEMTHLREPHDPPRPEPDETDPPSPRHDSSPPPNQAPTSASPVEPCDEVDARSHSPVDDDDLSSVQSGPSDMTVSRLHSPQPLPGPSCLPPVQQVPLVSTVIDTALAPKYIVPNCMLFQIFNVSYLYINDHFSSRTHSWRKCFMGRTLGYVWHGLSKLS